MEKKKIAYSDLENRDTPEEYLRGYIRDIYKDYAESREAR